VRYRPLGKTGLSLSLLGYGASPLGGVFGPVDQEDANRCVRAALDAGINYIDVAPYYGLTRAEAVLGNALRGIPRDDYVLSTKVGRYGHRDFDFSAARVVASVDESLTRLGVDHVDIVLCHDVEYGDLNQIATETLPALKERVVGAGKARFLGFSGLPLAIYPRIIGAAPGLVDVILSYCHHTLADTSLDTVLPYLHARGVGVINASPLGMGLLSAARPPTGTSPAALARGREPRRGALRRPRRDARRSRNRLQRRPSRHHNHARRLRRRRRDPR
jgi:L-galactose dehydrogenase